MESNIDVRIKHPTTYNEQIEIFKSRGLIVDDEEFAKRVLSRINYYRLSAYTLSLKKDNQFLKDVSFHHIYQLYEFDRKLRLLLLSQLEMIEIAARAKISHHLAHKYGATSHLNEENFDKPTYFRDMNSQIDREIKRSREVFVSHHKSKYDGVFPIWVVIEVTSFSLLSKIYSNLKSKDQTQIAKLYSGNRVYLKNWFYALSTVRNICAHFGRLYNRKLPIHIRLSKADRKSGIQGSTLFSAVFVMGKIISNRKAWNSFVTELSALIDEYNIIELNRTGFPENWEEILRNLQA